MHRLYMLLQKERGRLQHVGGALRAVGGLGWFAAFIYGVGGARRLAREENWVQPEKSNSARLDRVMPW